MHDIDLLTIGETMALFTAGTIGRASNATAWSMSVGGAESNAAVAAARMGARAAWCGLLGNDAAGDAVVDRLSAENIIVHAPRVDRFTGLMVRHERRAGHPSVDYHRSGSAASLLAPEHLPADLIARAQILHLTGITPALSTSAARAVERAIELAHENHTVVSFDVNYRSKLWDRDHAAATLRPLIARADVVFAGDDEARMVTGTDESDATKLAENLREIGPTDVVLKRGALGAVALIGDQLLEQGPLPTTSLDTVGAGDAFAGAYLAEQARGASAEERLMLGARVGAYAVSVPGDYQNLPTRAELDPDLEPGDVRR